MSIKETVHEVFAAAEYVVFTIAEFLWHVIWNQPLLLMESIFIISMAIVALAADYFVASYQLTLLAATAAIVKGLYFIVKAGFSPTLHYNLICQKLSCCIITAVLYVSILICEVVSRARYESDSGTVRNAEINNCMSKSRLCLVALPEYSESTSMLQPRYIHHAAYVRNSSGFIGLSVLLIIAALYQCYQLVVLKLVAESIRGALDSAVPKPLDIKPMPLLNTSYLGILFGLISYSATWSSNTNLFPNAFVFFIMLPVIATFFMNSILAMKHSDAASLFVFRPPFVVGSCILVFISLSVLIVAAVVEPATCTIDDVLSASIAQCRRNTDVDPVLCLGQAGQLPTGHLSFYCYNVILPAANATVFIVFGIASACFSFVVSLFCLARSNVREIQKAE